MVNSVADISNPELLVREKLDELKTMMPVHVIDAGKLLFDVDEDEYALLVKHMGTNPLDNWKEIIKEYTDLVYRM